MPNPTQIELLIKLNGGAPQTGVVTAAYSDVVTLSIANGSSARKAKYRIRAYPPGFPCPAGWTTNGVFYECSRGNGSDAINFTLPALVSAQWGKFIFDVTVDDQLYAGKVVSELYAKARLKIASTSGVEDIAYLEENEFDTNFGWHRGVQDLARRYDGTIPGSGDVGGDTSSVSGNIAQFLGTGGKDIRDSGVATQQLVYGIVDDARNSAVLLTGLTNNATPLQNAINAAAASTGKLRIPKGTVRIDSGLTFPSNFELEMSEGTTIDMSNAPAQTIAFSAAGSEGTPVALASNVAIGDTTIPVAAGAESGFAQGDTVRIYSAAVYDASNTSSKVGEIGLVASTASGSVVLETPLQGAYATADGAYIAKITPAENITITGGRVLGGGTPTEAGSDADHVGCKFTLTRNVRLKGVKFERTDLTGAWFLDSIQWIVDKCKFVDFVNDGLAYGVSADDSSQDGQVRGCHFTRVRHAFTTANTTTSHGLPRRIKVIGNHIWSTTPARGGAGGDALDTHGAAEDIEFLNNTVHSSTGAGVNVECSSATVSGNQIRNTADAGILVHNETDFEGEVSIVGNTIKRTADEGIRVNMPTRGATAKYKSILIQGNRITDPTGIGIYVINSVSATRMKNCSISGNVISGCGAASASIYLEDVEGAAISGNTISDPTNATSAGIRLRDCKNISVNGNTIKHADTSTGIGVYVNASSAGSCTGVVIEGNTVGGDTPSALKGVVLDNNATNCTIGKNNFTDCNTKFIRGTGSGHDIPEDVTLSATIASGAIAINQNTRELIVDTEAAAATDDLDTISGGIAGQRISIRSNNSSRDPTLKHNTGNMLLGADVTLATGNDLTTLMYCSSGHWRRVANATN